MEASASAWLCPTELDRLRVVEASPRVRRARLVAAGAVGVTLVAAAPWLGWWTLILFALAVANLATLERRFARSERPERVAANSLLFNLALFGAGVALSGGPDSPIIPWMVIPAGMAATRFRGRVVAAGVAVTAVAILAATVGVDPAQAARDPVPILTALVVLVSVSAIGWALMGAELHHRDAAVLDPLTGLLNRQALERRVAELEQQARLTGDPVCFVACDLDGFKRVNDTHGHDRGDVVLRAAAYEMRKCLRSFELVYRMGGEEFLVVLPGIDLKGGSEVAERLRRAIADGRPGGLELTMSVGVSAAVGAKATYENLFKAADEALYRAKREGRNRIATAPGVAVAAPSLAGAGG